MQGESHKAGFNCRAAAANMQFACKARAIKLALIPEPQPLICNLRARQEPFSCKARGIEDKNPRTGVASGRGKNPLFRECLHLHYAKLRNNPHARTTFPNYLLCSDLRIALAGPILRYNGVPKKQPDPFAQGY